MKAPPVLQALGLISGALLLTACSSKPKPAEVSSRDLYSGEGKRGITAAAYEEGVPGGVITNTYTLTANVAAVDPATRKITLAEPDGKKSVIKAGPEVVNFDQIKVGDRVRASVESEVVVSVSSGGGPAGASRSTVITPAEKGEKPSLHVTDTAETTGTVTAVDAGKQRATVRFPDGQTVIVKVRPDVDLTKVKKGDHVVIQTTQAVAVVVEAPE